MITKTSYTYTIRFLRQEKILRDHDAERQLRKRAHASSCCYLVAVRAAMESRAAG